MAVCAICGDEPGPYATCANCGAARGPAAPATPPRRPAAPPRPIGPPAATYHGTPIGEGQRPSPPLPFRPMTTATAVFTAVLLAAVAVDAFGGYAFFERAGLLGDLLAGREVTLDDADQADDRVQAATAPRWGAIAVVGSAFLVWVYRARSSVAAFDAVQLSLVLAGVALMGVVITYLNEYLSARTGSGQWPGPESLDLVADANPLLWFALVAAVAYPVFAVANALRLFTAGVARPVAAYVATCLWALCWAASAALQASALVIRDDKESVEAGAVSLRDYTESIRLADSFEAAASTTRIAAALLLTLVAWWITALNRHRFPRPRR